MLRVSRGISHHFLLLHVWHLPCHRENSHVSSFVIHACKQLCWAVHFRHLVLQLRQLLQLLQILWNKRRCFCIFFVRHCRIRFLDPFFAGHLMVALHSVSSLQVASSRLPCCSRHVQPPPPVVDDLHDGLEQRHSLECLLWAHPCHSSQGNR